MDEINETNDPEIPDSDIPNATDEPDTKEKEDIVMEDLSAAAEEGSQPEDEQQA